MWSGQCTTLPLVPLQECTAQPLTYNVKRNCTPGENIFLYLHSVAKGGK